MVTFDFILEFYTWDVLLISQPEKIGEKQLSVFGYRGGHISPLLNVALLRGMHLWTFITFFIRQDS